jgi:hypothetical protein
MTGIRHQGIRKLGLILIPDSRSLIPDILIPDILIP